MANHMEEVAQILGLQLGQHFRIKQFIFDLYRISENGLEMFGGRNAGDPNAENPDDTKWFSIGGQRLSDILRGIYTIADSYVPDDGDEYFIPRPADKALFSRDIWHGDEDDFYRFNLGVVCRDQKEAIEIAKQMQAVTKQEAQSND